MNPRIGIIGTGRLGSQLIYWLARAGRPASVILAREPMRAATAIRLSGLGTSTAAGFGGVSNPTSSTIAAADIGTFVAESDVILLAVPDRAIKDVAASLAAHDLSGKIVAHCCGALPASEIAIVGSRGGQAACFHPIQSFPPLAVEAVVDSAPERSHFGGIAAGIESSDAAFPSLEWLARSLGCMPLRISGDPRQRALYHAAAVVASNAMVGLLDFGMELMAHAGIEREHARLALLPLMGGTLANLATYSPGAALTGPIARGDGETIAAHLDALSGDPSLQALYSNLSARLLLLAAKSGRITEAQAYDMSVILLTRLRDAQETPSA